MASTLALFSGPAAASPALAAAGRLTYPVAVPARTVFPRILMAGVQKGLRYLAIPAIDCIFPASLEKPAV